MPQHEAVTSEQWLAFRKELLLKEKEFPRRRDELTQLRRDLPWVKVERDYIFDGPDGKESLADLFAGCRQLIIYHSMFGPDWPEGCKICSMLGDHFDPLVVHLKHRDVTLAAVSRAPFETLQEFGRRMGWSFKWFSSYGTDFNWDFNVSFTQEDMDAGRVYYNYQAEAKFPATEGPGISSFYRDENNEVYHTYSSFGRGLENFLGIYNFLDIVPRGRDEDGLPYPMAWVRHKDRYDDESFVDPYVKND